MNGYRSLSLTFRVALAFHGLNMEGTSGNVIEPRRISLGDAEYDGISGEIIRRHILENFRDLAGDRLPLHPGCRGLIPERGKQALATWMQISDEVEYGGTGVTRQKNLNPEDKTPAFSPATRQLLSECALCDIGGYLMAFERTDPVTGTLKRDSTFEVGWLISEHPSQADYTQHAAYKPDQQHNLFTMGMRSAVYGGVMRFDLDRIGHNDWWWLAPDGAAQRWPVSEDGRKQRARALLTAVQQWLLSPSGARQAGWLQHQGDPFEGILVLSKGGPAPFVSPIALEVEVAGNGQARPRVKANSGYRETVKRLTATRPAEMQAFEFANQAELVEQFDAIFTKLNLTAGAQPPEVKQGEQSDAGGGPDRG